MSYHVASAVQRQTDVCADETGARISYLSENFMYAYHNLFRVTILTLSLVIAAGAQQDEPKKRQARRLESVTWSPADHKLTWTVIDGSLKDGKFQPGAKISFEINMDAATMHASGEDRRFSKQEAASVHRLMDLVAKYAAESTLWWEAGEGERLDGGDSSKVDRKENEKRNDRPEFLPERPNRKEDPRDRKVIKISLQDLEDFAASRTIE